MNETILDKVKKTYSLLAAEPACKGQAAVVKTLEEKLVSRNMTVSIIGQFKRGKSSLSNAILEDEILPVGIVPVTSAVTRVVYGKKAAYVHFLNGVVEEVPFDELHTYISEQENCDNRLGVEAVVLHTPSKFLKKGLVFVDTPGVGSFHKNNTETAYRYMKESDAVIFLLSPDSPINQIEIDFLANTREFAAKFYFAVNKTDLVSESDLTAYNDYCRRLLCRLMEVDDVAMYSVSAKTGAGVKALEDAIAADCKRSAEEILDESSAKKLKDVISKTVQQLSFYRNAMNMEYRDLDEKFASVRAASEEIKEKAGTFEGAFEIHLNEIKIELSGKVKELFGMEYNYEITELPSGLCAMDREDFISQVDNLCDDLEETLNRILLYREENAYTVVRRITNINNLTKRLRRISDSL